MSDSDLAGFSAFFGFGTRRQAPHVFLCPLLQQCGFLHGLRFILNLGRLLPHGFYLRAEFPITRFVLGQFALRAYDLALELRAAFSSW
ncbi:MAG: hypothetical protein U0361_04830 [Nitrospiraceae bacterium]